MKKKFFIFLIMISIIPCIWGISIIKCEILTALHKDEFTSEEVSAILSNEQELKVLSYSDNKADVYYLSKQKTMGNRITFEKTDGLWQIKSWDTVWSINGNADGIVWPYWWHFFYSH